MFFVLIATGLLVDSVVSGSGFEFAVFLCLLALVVQALFD